MVEKSQENVVQGVLGMGTVTGERDSEKQQRGSVLVIPSLYLASDLCPSDQGSQ
jgi:hypothetical protein